MISRRGAALACLLSALGPPLAGRADDGGFAPRLPDGVVDVSAWERVTGDFETPKARGTYWFYVNPERRAMYQLMRYRVDVIRPWPAVERRHGSTERVAFVANPGTREPMLFWERRERGAEPAWRPIAPDSDEYRAEIGVLMAVLEVHRAARAAQP